MKGWGKGEKQKSNNALKEARTALTWNKKRTMYTPEQKKAYRENKSREVKGGNPGKIEHTDWTEAHKDVKSEVRQKRQRANQCTRCGIPNHSWKYCRKQAVVSTVGERWPQPNTRRGFRGFQNRRPQVSTTTQQANPNQNTSQSRQVNRPKVWELDDMDET